MRKLSIKCLRPALLVAIGFLALSSFAGTMILRSRLPPFEQRLADSAKNYQLHSTFQLYLFPAWVILFDLVIDSENPASDTRLLRAPVSLVNFSVTELVLKQTFTFSRIILLGAQIHQPALIQLFREHGERLLKLLRTQPNANGELWLWYGTITAGTARDPLTRLDANLKIAADRFVGEASFRSLAPDPHRRILRGLNPAPLVMRTRFNGKILANGLDFDNLELAQRLFYVQIWGKLRSPVFQFNGFAFVNGSDTTNTIKPDLFSRKPRARPLAPYLGVSGSTVYVLDMNGQTTSTANELVLNRIDALINQIPVMAKGRLTLTATGPVTLNMFLFPPRAFKNQGGIKHLIFNFTGQRNGQVLTGDAMFATDFSGDQKSMSSLKQITAKFPQIAVDLGLGFDSTVQIPAGQITLAFGDRQIDLPITQIRSQVNISDPRFKSWQVHFAMNHSRFMTRIWSDDQLKPGELFALFTAQDIDLSDPRLSESLTQGTITGTAQAKIFLRTDAPQWLSGSVTVSDGTLQNIDFFDWLSVNFALPRLKPLQFRTWEAELMADPQNWGIKRLTLRSAEIHINGNFFYRKDGLIASQITVLFSRALLSQSPRLLPLVKSAAAEEDVFPFDFQLSGRPQAMNFQWLPSELKTRVQRLIPDFVEQSIETHVEKGLLPTP